MISGERRVKSGGAINLDELLSDIDVPSFDIPDLASPPSALHSPLSKDLFAEKKHAAWKDVQQDEARCDFAPNKVRISYRNPAFGIISLWKKSLYGRTLTDIKGDDSMVKFFADGIVGLIRQILGHSLSNGNWAIVTSPKRRHKERNFASMISANSAQQLAIPFYEDLVECHSKHRVGAEFSMAGTPPKERNLIIYDDFVTSGSTMLSMYNLFKPLGYNSVYLSSISNKF